MHERADSVVDDDQEFSESENSTNCRVVLNQSKPESEYQELIEESGSVQGVSDTNRTKNRVDGPRVIDDGKELREEHGQWPAKVYTGHFESDSDEEIEVEVPLIEAHANQQHRAVRAVVTPTAVEIGTPTMSRRGESESSQAQNYGETFEADDSASEAFEYSEDPAKNDASVVDGRFEIKLPRKTHGYDSTEHIAESSAIKIASECKSLRHSPTKRTTELEDTRRVGESKKIGPPSSGERLDTRTYEAEPSGRNQMNSSRSQSTYGNTDVEVPEEEDTRNRERRRRDARRKAETKKKYTNGIVLGSPIADDVVGRKKRLHRLYRS